MNVISKDGTRIAYEVHGSGPALILVDGAMCFRASGPMLPLAHALKSDFTVYAYDRRGRGESSDIEPYDVQREIDDIEALVEAAGGSAYLYGTSSGAVLALKATARLGSKIKALALYEPPLVLDAREREEVERYSQDVERALEKGDNEAIVMLFIQRVAKALDMPDMVEGVRQSPMWAGMVALAPTIAYDNRVMGSSDIPHEAGSIKVPTIVMWGEASSEMMQAAGRALADSIPQSMSKILDGQTHDANTEVMSAALLSFFSKRSM